MNELVIIENKQAVTTSLQVAESFKKRHDHVLRDVENLKKDVPNFGEMFFETESPDSYGRVRKTYLMNRDGFTLLAMGFTGKKALEFKLKYIEAFNQLEETLKQPKQLTAREEMLLIMRVNEETAQRVDEIDEKVNYLTNTMRIDGVEQQQINELGKQKAMEALGGKDAPAYKDCSRRVFNSLWGDFKKHFVIPRYSELPKVKFDEALHFLNIWQPNASLKIEISKLNQQGSLF